MDNKPISIGLAVVAIVIAIFALTRSVPPTAGNTTASFWDSAQGYKVDGVTIIDGSGLFPTLMTLNAGTLHSYTNSTTTTATAQTLIVSDVQGYDTVILTPNVGSDTVTLFASTTASTWLPTAGDSQRTCFINGTTTPGINLTLAGGTGTPLLVASSSATALGSLVIGPQKKGCLDFTRGNTTATTFDIIASLTSFL